ncbi:MAG: DNA-directed RNA polymerase subunit beta, partial [Planctomycetes bacterium]|nr:DNA-directed RNA polymerase subunit beta [Planctomycetota bacterium]
MPIPAVRIIQPTTIRNFGRFGDAVEVPPLTDVQTESYKKFLQLEISPEEREAAGLEGVLKEIFPIESYDKKIALEYVKYELGKPRYDPDECRQLRLTYGRPFKVWLRLRKTDGSVVEEEVYLGDMPIMIGGGEFIINGAERVVVSQLHRSPGVDFVLEIDGDAKLHSCRIIPERGSWIEINVTKKGTLGVRIDQSGKFSAMTLLRAMDPMYSQSAAIIREFYTAETLKMKSPDSRSRLAGDPDKAIPPMLADDDVIDPETGEVYLNSGESFTQAVVDKIVASKIKELTALAPPRDPLILSAIIEDGTESHEAALLKIYQRLRPGNPPQLEKARDLFKEKFADANRYRLGKVGRFRINRKFDQNVPETEMTLRAVDFVNAIKYLLKLRDAQKSKEEEAQFQVDDIDHLGNRRLRTIDELASDELRKGFLKLRRTVQERMAIREQQDMSPRSLINPKSVSAAIEYFFGRSELSQVVDQTNPLAQLTHERRLSALGPGGLNRKRAGFEVRDVHIS